MKDFSQSLMDSFEQRVTTIANCIKIIRTDGVTYRFTSLDKNLIIDNEIYVSSYSFGTSAYSSSLGIQSEDMEVQGAIGILGISDFDVIKGLFYNAQVWLFAVDYKNISAGKNKILYGTVGQIEITDKIFKFEIKSISKKYKTQYSSYYGKLCRTKLGSTKCGIDLETYKVSGVVNPTAFYDPIKFKYLKFSFSIPDIYYGGFPLHDIDLLNEAKLAVEFKDDLIITVSSTNYSELCTDPNQTFPLTNMIDNDLNTYYCLGVANRVSHSITFEATKSILFDYIKITTTNISIPTLTEMDISISFNGIDWYEYPTVNSSVYKIGNTYEIPLAILLSTNLSNRYSFRSRDLRGFEPNYFQYGKIKWTTGQNAPQTADILLSDSSGFIELALQMPYEINPNDSFDIYPGCNHLAVGNDGRYSGHCITKFNNMKNFRGEPYLPNEDMLLSGYVMETKETEEAPASNTSLVQRSSP